MQSIPPTPSRPLRRLLAALLAMALAIGAGAIATAGSSAAARPHGPKPTIVLVHGGWDNSTGWNAVVEKLQRRGYPGHRPGQPAPQPGVRRRVRVQRPRHHRGPGRAGRPLLRRRRDHQRGRRSRQRRGPRLHRRVRPRRRRVAVPAGDDEPGQRDRPEHPHHPPVPAPRWRPGHRPVPHPDRAQDGLRRRCPLSGRRTRCSPRSDPSRRKPSEAPQAPPPGRRSRRGTSWPADDRAIPPATQRFMAERAGAHTSEVRSSHVPQISQPDNTVEVILKAAESLH